MLLYYPNYEYKRTAFIFPTSPNWLLAHSLIFSFSLLSFIANLKPSQPSIFNSLNHQEYREEIVFLPTTSTQTKKEGGPTLTSSINASYWIPKICLRFSWLDHVNIPHNIYKSTTECKFSQSEKILISADPSNFFARKFDHIPVTSHHTYTPSPIPSTQGSIPPQKSLLWWLFTRP